MRVPAQHSLAQARTILRFAQSYNSEISLHNTKDIAAHLDNPEAASLKKPFCGKNAVSHFVNKMLKQFRATVCDITVISGCFQIEKLL